MTQISLEQPCWPGDFLATKLEIPLLGYRIIQRSRLTALLQTGLKRRMTLIVAQAGYGKTTLLVEWLSTIKTADWRIAWVSVDPSDNTPLWFWSYVAASLKKVSSRIHFNPKQMIQHGYDPQDILQLNTLLNEIEHIPHPMCLVLDNYEAIKDENIQRGVGYLIDHQPDNLHLILSSRVVPPIPLARLRIQRQLVEITEKDLSFTLQEANAFLAEVMELDLTAEKVAALLDATEGWIAGLQLAALSMQGRPDFQPMQDHLLDDNRQILAYLTEEVLNQQEPEIRDFLLKTSILTELCAPLCDALLERTDSQDLLARIELGNLFVISLDEHQYWYRYHPLFAEALRVHLTSLHPELVGELHRKACTWLLAHGYPEKAVSHAQAAGDFKKAAEIVDDCAMQAIMDLDLSNVVNWISRFSDDLLRTQPSLGIYYALANFLLGQLELIEPKLQIVERALQESQENQISGEEEKLIRWEMFVMRAVLDCMQGDFNQGIPHVQKLMKNVPKEDGYFFGFMNHWLAETHDSIGDLDAAASEFTRAIQFAHTHALLIGMAQSGCGLARIRKKQGRLLESEQEYQKALGFAQQSGKDLSLIALAQTSLTEIALERMDSRLNDDWVQDIAKHYNQIEASALKWDNLVLLSLRLAKYFLAYQDLDNALLYFRKAMSSLQKPRQPRAYLPLEFIDVQMDIWAATGELQAPERRFEEELRLLNPTGKATVAEQAASARISLARHKPAQALAILEDLEAVTRRTGQGERLIETLILKALAYQANGQKAQALQLIGRALRLARPEGYTRLFVDEGQPMKDLLDEYQSMGQVADPGSYLQKLVGAFERRPGTPPLQVQSQPSQTSLITPLLAPLSEREVEVLQMLAAGKSAKEMATNLMISVNTVKTHVKSIYRKLGGHTRNVVFQRADELGFLTRPPEK